VFELQGFERLTYLCVFVSVFELQGFERWSRHGTAMPAFAAAPLGRHLLLRLCAAPLGPER
jgi:hypothetical protein